MMTLAEPMLGWCRFNGAATLKSECSLMAFLAERKMHCRLPLSTATPCLQRPLQPSTICGVEPLSAATTPREFRGLASPRELTAQNGGSPSGSMKMAVKDHERSRSRPMESERQNNLQLLNGSASLNGFSKSKARHCWPNHRFERDAPPISRLRAPQAKRSAPCRLSRCCRL